MTAADVYAGQPQQQSKDAARARLTTYLDILDEVSKLSPAMRLDLAHFILRSVSDDLHLDDDSLAAAKSKRKMTWAEYLRQRPSSNLPPPTNEELAQWKEDYYTERYG